MPSDPHTLPPPLSMPPVQIQEDPADAETRGRVWTADLLVLAAFLALVVLFGRPFAKLGIGDRAIFITEPTLLLISGLALARVGWSGAIERIRSTVPLTVLILLWLAGAIAVARGLYLFGFESTTYDVGLLAYSVMLAIVPVVIDTRARLMALLRVLALAGLGAALIYVGQRFIDHESITNTGPALGIYMTMFVVAVAARQMHGLRTPPLAWLLLLFTASAMSFLLVRSVWAGMLVTVVALAVLAPRRRLAVLVVAIAVFGMSNVAAYGLARLEDRIGSLSSPASVEVAPKASPDYVADDGLVDFNGGRVVRGDAAQGEVSREIKRGELLEIPSLTNLADEVHTVVFSVKPMSPMTVSGRVGNTAGDGWGSKSWEAGPRSRWQSISVRLRPRSGSERFVLIADTGAGVVRFDAVKVLRGQIDEPASAYQSASPSTKDSRVTNAREKAERQGSREASRITNAREKAERQGSREAPSSVTRPSLITETQGTFSADVAGPSYNNTQWRLAIWRFMLERAASQPMFGVGFGRPTNFRWRTGLGGLYDQRRGDPSMQDVTGPHNSFVNLAFRTGLSGIAPLLILMILAAVRTVSLLRRQRGESRAVVVAVATLFLFTCVQASLAVALEGPHMGIIFWGSLALLLAMPTLIGAKPHRLAPRLR